MWRQYRPFVKGEFIVVGVDTSTGLSDYSCAQFLSHTKLDVPLVYHSKILATEMTNAIFPTLEKIHDETGLPPLVAYERNNGGVFEIERLAALNRLHKFDLFKMPGYGNVDSKDQESVKWGWDTNTATRPKMLGDLKEAVDKRLIRIYDKPTIEELYSFVIVRTTSTEKAQAEQGAHDDLVMSLAIAWQLYQHGKVPVRHISTPPPLYRPSDDVIGI